ncbi:MAG: hypothetical protein ACP5KG_05590 [Myxococcota bacterium]
MRWRYLIHLVFVSIFIIITISGCNCGDTPQNSNESDDSTERVNHGYSAKDEYGNQYIKKCDKTYADCNKKVDDGCEANLTNDINNCGSCGKVCIASANVSAVACKDSNCVIDYCVNGYTDLDKKYENGCEYYCTRRGEKEIEGNMEDDDCDGYIDNVCRFAVDSNSYLIASNLRGRVTDIFSISNENYSIVGFVESASDGTDYLMVSAIDSQRNLKFTTEVRKVAQDGDIGSVAMLINDSSIFVFWSENYNESSKIYLSRLNLDGVVKQELIQIYEGLRNISNLIIGVHKGSLYLSFETTENNIKSVFLLEIDVRNNEVVSKRLISTANIDCYGHNIYFLDNILYVSYWEMRSGYLELVIMTNDLETDKKWRYPIRKTEMNAVGSALGYGSGKFILIWTESTSTLGTMYLSVLNDQLQSIVLKKVEISYEESGLPVIDYNGNIFGNAFGAVKNNKNYILFSDIDISGKKISELIISPVTILEKPYMSFANNEFFVFYTDINSKMQYFLNMKRVYCIKD